MNPKEVKRWKELLQRSDRRFENLVRAIENYGIHLDVICYDYKPSKNEVAISHTLTSACNPKEIIWDSTRKGVHENNKRQRSYGSFVSSFLLSVKNSVKRKI